MILQSEDEEEVAGHIDLAERIQVTTICLFRFIQISDLFRFFQDICIQIYSKPGGKLPALPDREEAADAEGKRSHILQLGH